MVTQNISVMLIIHDTKTNGKRTIKKTIRNRLYKSKGDMGVSPRIEL